VATSSPQGKIPPASPAQASLSAPPKAQPTPVSSRSEENSSLAGGWYLSWGPWASKQEASYAFPGIYQNVTQQNISTDKWLLQKTADGKWALIAGPVEIKIAVESLKFSTPPSALFRP
jgi:beta-galactosidase/beta-glucuronidase